jgi:CubicO group peptidase (beta-lactamase class C family)
MIIFLILIANVFSQIYIPQDNDTWETVTPEELNWCVEEIEKLDEFLFEKNTRAFIILKDGKIVYEKYFYNFHRDSSWYWASAAKTLTATLIGIAIEENKIDLFDKTSKYLGEGWTSLSSEKEDLITIHHQLAMTTGLDETTNPNNEEIPEKLTYLTDAGQRWFYYNSPYTLLHNVLESAYSQNLNIITNQKIKNKINMQGFWLGSLFFSKPIDAARFGLMIMNNGKWGDESVIDFNLEYPNMMTESTSELNPAYGYLWWLNGKNKYMQPGIDFTFNGRIVSNADDNMFMAAGKNDQRIYIDRKNGLVVVRMGEAADESVLALSGFDNQLWEKINNLVCNTKSVEKLPTFYHNSQNLYDELEGKDFQVYDLNGKVIDINSVNSLKNKLENGIYIIKIHSKTSIETIKIIKN